MTIKFALLFCAQFLLLQAAFRHCVNRGYTGKLAGKGYSPTPDSNGLGAGCGTARRFFVTSTSPLAPTGVAVVFENAIEGVLNVEGSLPILGSATLRGALETDGSCGVSCSSGDHSAGSSGVAIESPIKTSILGASRPAVRPVDLTTGAPMLKNGRSVSKRRFNGLRSSSRVV